MPISGHSVFSRDAVRDAGWYKMRGGLSGSQSIVSTEELDEKIQSLVLGSHAEWMDDYLRKMDRRDEG